MFDGEITFLIVCFLRREKAERLVSQIRQIHGRGPRVIVVDNSPKPLWPGGSMPGAEVMRCESAGNLSAARNIGLKAIKTKFFCLLDDDEILVGDPVGRIYGSIRENRADVCCGVALAANDTGGFHEDNYSGHFHIEDRTLRLRPFLDPKLPQRGDIGSNFFLGSTALVRRMGGWDSRIPIVSEHIDFFLRAKQAGLRVFYEPRARVENDKGGDGQLYYKSRHRFDVRRTMMMKHDLVRFCNNIGTEFIMRGGACQTRKRPANLHHAVVIVEDDKAGRLDKMVRALGATGDDGMLLRAAWGREDVADAIDDAVHFMLTRSLRIVVGNGNVLRMQGPCLRHVIEKRAVKSTWLWLESDRPHFPTKRPLWESIHPKDRAEFMTENVMSNPLREAKRLADILGWGHEKVVAAADAVRTEEVVPA